MYRKFFGLTLAPFNNTPDPKFFFETPQHEEALASLRYTAEQRKGFVLVTGEVGSGKTLLGRLLMQQLGSRARIATIGSSALSPHELMTTLCHELEIPLEPGANKTQLTQALQDYLLDKHAKDRLVVVLLDEAQNLPTESFEELRMLGNLEADDAKLLQVLILSQPEILKILRRPDMTQLRQRIVRTVHLSALGPEETAGYIAHRLAVAGGDGKIEFTEGAIGLIHIHSEGMPRMINHLCDESLLTAYAKSVKTIDAAIAQEAIVGMAALHGSPAEEAPIEPLEPDRPQRPRETQAVPQHDRILRQTSSQGLAEPIDEARLARNKLDPEAEQIVEENTRRGMPPRRSLSQEFDGRMVEMKGALAELRQDAGRLIESAGRRDENLERHLAEGLEEQLERAQRTLTRIRQDAGRIADHAGRPDRELQGPLPEQLGDRLGEIQEVLTELSQGANRVLEEAHRRGQVLRQSLSEDLAGRIGRIEGVLVELIRDADGIVEKTARRSMALQQSISADLEGRVAKLEQTLAALSKDADNIVEKSSRKATELRELSEAIRGVTKRLTQQNNDAKAHCTRLAQENARATELTPVIQDARQTIGLLGQARKHADKHTSRLTRETARADELIRDMPELIEQLQAATTEARTVSTNLDRQTKAMAQKLDRQIKAMEEKLDGQMKAMRQHYEDSQKQLTACQGQINQMDKLLSRAGRLVSVLTAVGQAVASSAEPELSVSAAASAAQTRAQRQGVVGFPERKLDAGGSSGSQPATIPSDNDAPEDLPPLIEFDPRRAAAAQRIANAQRGSLRGATTAKHA